MLMLELIQTMSKELSSLFGSSAPDNGRYAIWCRPADSSWVRYSRYNDSLSWLCDWTRQLSKDEPSCDWAVRSPGSSIDIIMIPASVGVDSDVD